MTTTRLTDLFRRLHADENGDIPVGPILVIGLIVIPLVIGLIAFGTEITRWLGEKWQDVTGAGTVTPFTP